MKAVFIKQNMSLFVGYQLRNGFKIQDLADKMEKTSHRIIKNKTLVIIGVSVICVVLALVIAVGVLADKSSKVVYKTLALERQENSAPQGEDTALTSCQKCVKNPNALNPDLDYAKCILDHYPLVDGHNDMAYEFYSNVANKVYSVDMSQDLRKQYPNATNYTHTDIPRLREGKLSAQFWSLFVLCTTQHVSAVQRSLEQLDTIKKFTNKYPSFFKFVTTADGIQNAFDEGKFASLIGMEGGHSINSSLGSLRMFYDLGVRYMTLTHNCNPPWADSHSVETESSIAKHNGLTKFGEIVVKEMNRLGMLIDLAHVSKKTMIDAISVSRAPVIFSHSSAYTLCNSSRNVPDDVLMLTKKNGGIVMVNFYPYFVTCKGEATLGDVADHIEYIKNKIGIDYVGIGGDFDGMDILPKGLEDVSKYPFLFAELVRRNWTEEDLAKVAGQNIIRVFKRAEEVRDELQFEKPSEDILEETDI